VTQLPFNVDSASEETQHTPDACNVLAIGASAAGLCATLVGAHASVTWLEVGNDEQALFKCCDMPVHCVVVSHHGDPDALRDRVARLQEFGTVGSVFVVTDRHEEITALDIDGVCGAVPRHAPTQDVVDAIFGAEKNRETETVADAPSAKPVRWWAKPLLTPLMAALYKNGALVCLAGLFTLFVSYGVLICFFLLSTGWSAPTALSSGHELVIRTAQKIGELGVKANQVEQRIGDAKEEAHTAQRAQRDALSLGGIVDQTLEVEIRNLEILKDDLLQMIARFKTVRDEFRSITGDEGAGREFDIAFKERLINKETYKASRLSLLEASHRLAAVESELARRKRELEQTRSRIAMLHTLKRELATDNLNRVIAADVQMVPLAEQVIDVKTKRITAASTLKSIEERLKLLEGSLEIIRTNAEALSRSPLGRAAVKPIHVLFVPYENADQFKAGQPIYDCVFLIVVCRKVGQTGAEIVGEVSAVHPFFGKPVRGQFVNVELDDPAAVRKQWLHAGRPPLFF